MKKSFLDTVESIFIIYKMLPLIIIVVILLIIGYFRFAKPVEKEYESYGYGKFETAQIDPMTGEIIPKDKISTYNNSSKTIVGIDGEKVSFTYINKTRDKICNSLKETGEIANESTLKVACDMLLVEKLGATYEIKDNSLYINGMWMSGKIDCRDTINLIVKKIYREQNGLTP